MRSEDRKPSKRVFPLLQNLDLDSLTFAQVQGVGDPVTIEDMNEQEMVDLIIVNLARLVVAGEWDGLLEAGGGATAPMLAVTPPSASYDYDLSGQSQGSQAANVAFPEDTIYLIPFSIPVQTSPTNFKFSIASGTFDGTFYAAIYTCDLSTNLPNSRQQSVSASISSTGDKTISLPGTALPANTILYAAISWERTSGTCSYGGGYFEYGRSGMPILASSAISTNSGGCLTYSASGEPPAELTQSSIGVFVGAAPKIRLGVS